ncbi:MAG TPA: hypothetical protein PKC59_05580 [Burkholderiaceae bacterium]|nr:hypothetical protein [Burkholderiaceae bacterium]HMX09622.1 hypothetical protein [Burkholderiaceae bacterium]HMY99618.1 hypothetical protein [Burkholderiaceae bacterium]HNB44374.1 hypothetical protein [Burkholderiaceae bacterium]HNG78252.1 hypothetical protein [Burkholderiaceae bacterium]
MLTLFLLSAWGAWAAAQTPRLVTGEEAWLAPAGAASASSTAAAALTTEGAVQIRSINPAPTQLLTAGQRVRVTVEVAYTLPRPQGRLALAFQEPSPTRRPLAATVAELTSAEGVVTLSADVRVPATATLEVYVPLYARDGVATAVVDTRSYRIARRR